MNDPKNIIQALGSTLNEMSDSKKWIGSYVATIVASVLVIAFGVSPEVALLLVSPIVAGVLGQAHVDAATAKASGPSSPGNVGNMVVNDPGPATPTPLAVVPPPAVTP